MCPSNVSVLTGMSVAQWHAWLKAIRPRPHEDSCPECGTRGYHVLPARSDCSVCISLRIEALS